MGSLVKFKDKYTTDLKESKKILISKDAYAIGEMIEELKDQISFRRGGL